MPTWTGECLPDPIFTNSQAVPMTIASEVSLGRGEIHCDGSIVDGSLDYPEETRNGECYGDTFSTMEGRIIIKPVHIDAGFVITEVLKTALIWNLFPGTATLDSIILEDADGIDVTGISVGNSIFTGRDKIVTYTIGVVGPAVIEAIITFEFDLQNVRNTIEGFRGVSFTLEPLLRGYGQEYILATEVVRSEAGVEFRRDLSNDEIPVRRVNASYKLTELRQIAEVQNLATFGAKYTLFVPLWFDQMELSAPTTGADAEVEVVSTSDSELVIGGEILIMVNPRRARCETGPAFEVRKIVAFDADSIELDRAPSLGFETGDLLIPMINATPEVSTNWLSRLEREGMVGFRFTELR